MNSGGVDEDGLSSPEGYRGSRKRGVALEVMPGLVLQKTAGEDVSSGVSWCLMDTCSLLLRQHHQSVLVLAGSRNVYIFLPWGTSQPQPGHNIHKQSTTSTFGLHKRKQHHILGRYV